GTWLKQVDGMEQTGTVPNLGCLHWYEISIIATGEVSLCCMDGQGDWSLGDVRKTHVLDIYNQPRYLKLRERSLSRLALEPCNGCTYL
ncbi:MAG TPA: SPASM domain-containing protein, partial [Candidatus Obscuribacterales bacterium]